MPHAALAEIFSGKSGVRWRFAMLHCVRKIISHPSRWLPAYQHTASARLRRVSGSGSCARLAALPSLQEGGETVFPNAGPKVTGEGWSECARQGFAVKAKRGDAVLFWVAAWGPRA